MIEGIVDRLVNMIETVGYLGVAIAVFIESFFAPIPSELILPFAGFLAAEGEMNIVVLLIISGIASYLGTLPFYFLGYWGNDAILVKFVNKWGKYIYLSQKEVDKATEYFNKYGKKIVFYGRLFPVIRSLISLPAGIAKMNLIEFTVYTLLGSMLWSAVLIFGGYFLGDNWDVISGYIKEFEHIIIILIVIVGGYFGYRYYKSKKALN